MSEWKQNERRTSGFPEGIEEGMVLDVKFRNGDIERRTVGYQEGSDLDGLSTAHFNTKDGYSVDVMAYRIVSAPAAAPAITQPDYSKGFPVGTIANDIGAKVGDEFLMIDDAHRGAYLGEKVILAEDDGTTSPFFTNTRRLKHCINWRFLSPIPPKTAIELQAEEVGIPEPVRLVDDAKPDADGWIEWKGGECPVERGTLIDAKFRNGEVTFHAKARYGADDGGSSEIYCTKEWSHDGSGVDIIAYRLHQPQEWPEDRMDVIGQNGNDALPERVEIGDEVVREDYTSGGAGGAKARESLAKLVADGVIDPANIVRREDVNLGPKSERKPTNKYQRTIKGVTVDVYDVLAAFGVTCQARGHAIKKLLMAGQRGHKDKAQDLREAMQAIERSIQLTEGGK